jgi:hypothetical protein
MMKAVIVLSGHELQCLSQDRMNLLAISYDNMVGAEV